MFHSNRLWLEKKLNIQYQVAHILANTENLEEISSQFLEAVCQELQWEVGAIWRVDRNANLLRCMEVWCRNSPDIREFQAVTRHAAFPPGIDLPGRVWKNNSSLSIPDVVKDKNFPRAASAEKAHLHAGFGFPVRLKGEAVGVVEFFARHCGPLDSNLVGLFDTIGDQIGQFMHRRQLEMDKIYLGAIVESSEDSIIGMNIWGVISSWNYGAQHMYGYMAQEIIGKSIEILIPSDKTDELAAIFQAIAQNKRVESIETVRVAKDGKILNVSLVVSPIRNSEGHFVGVSMITRDITERKKTELELEEKNRQLQKLSALKDEFVATVSHELRTPLTAIKEGISLILDGILGDFNAQQKDFLMTVDQNVDRLGELINHMLDLSKIEAGRMKLFRKKISLPKMVQSTLDVYKPLVGTRTLKLEGESVPDAFVDSNRLFQVMGNFLSNAIKFTEKDGKIIVSLKTLGNFVSVSVQDDGIGIAESDIPKLFLKFSQIETGNERPRGTGLGLALSKDLVEMHHGTVEVRSELGQGSTFSFTVPVYTPQLALSENFQEAVDFAIRHNRETVGMTVVDCLPIGASLIHDGSQNPSQMLEKMAELIGKLVHGDDLVFSIDSRWVVILSVVDALGLQSISERIRIFLREHALAQTESSQNLPIRIGTALYPTDGTDVHTLFAKVTQTLLLKETPK